MKNFLLIFLFALIITSCVSVQSQQNSENKSQPTPTIADTNNQGEEIGYARFTTTDKQYLGCWRSVKAEEVADYKLKFFQITEKTFQTSKMQKPVSYSIVSLNNYKDYFVFKVENNNNDIQPYLNINLVSDDEMTIGEYKTSNLVNEESGNYWDLKRENCDKIAFRFKR